MTSFLEKLSRQPPHILYKYRSWNNQYHKRLLSNNEIYFSSARAFNDPFDCRIPICHDLMTDQQIWQQCLGEAQQRRPGASGEELASAARKIQARSGFRDPHAIKRAQEAWQDMVFTWFGVFSLSEDRGNILMWSHYADCHKGFCVGFDRHDLKTEADRLKDCGISIHAHPVIYAEEYPAIPPDDSGNHNDIKEMLLTKSKQWEYEQEWRVLLFEQTNQAVTLSDSVFAEVILGCSMPEEHKKEIIDVVRSKSHPISIYQAKRKERQFGLDLECLNV
jgi:hypothetical protein